MASRLLGAATAATAAVALLGAGEAGAATPRVHRHRSETPAQLVAKSEHALAKVDSFTLNGYLTEDHGRMGLLLRSTGHGTRAAGTLTSTTRAGTGFLGRVSFVRIGAAFYLKGDQRFWATSAGSMPKAAVRALEGQWIRMPGNQVKKVAGTFGAFTNPGRLAASLLGSSALNQLRLGPRAKVAGTPVVTIRASEGVLYLARNGAPLPVRLTATGKSAGSFRFGYPHALTVKAPASAKSLTQVEKAAAAAATGG